MLNQNGKILSNAETEEYLKMIPKKYRVYSFEGETISRYKNYWIATKF